MSLWRNVFAAAVALVAMFLAAPVASAGTHCAALTTPVAAPGEDIPPLDQLACADLRGFDFLQEDLTGANLHGSNLAGVRLVQATLSNADLSGAILTDADLGQAQLDGANLSAADLTGAWAGQANLAGAKLSDAVLRNTTLIQANLTGADLTGADLTGADLTQAQTDAPPTPTETTPVETPEETPDEDAPVLNPGDSAPTVVQPAEDEPQIAFLLLWPAAAIALAWLRTRFGLYARHRGTTPIPPVGVVGGLVGVVLVMTGLYLAATAAFRSIASDAAWTRDPGPLAELADESIEQFVVAVGAFVLGVLVLLLTRPRKQERGAPAVGQLTIGRPTPGRVGVGYSRPVRWFTLAVAFAGLADLVTVVVLLAADGLPETGLWQADTAAGHLLFVAVATLILFRTSVNTYHGREVASPSGVVFVTGVREPFLWLSGKSADEYPASQALPWEQLDRVHLLRTLGTETPSAAMISVRRPGTDRPTEYPEELRVTPAQATALYAALPPEMITEHTRAPRSD